MKKPIQPPRYFVICLILIILFHFVLPIKKIINPPYSYLGIILVLFGIIINLWTDKFFTKFKTDVKYHLKPSKMIVSGPFKISRNPMYLGMLCILLGVATFLGSLVTIIPTVIFILIIEIVFIPVEEKNMKKVFGKNYLKYKKRVRKWI